ncbi:MAG: disulfide bond formation protein DsbA [Alteromonadaceae bacterium]|nr:disulfide bond formation protein DsbA [Alteromonadaceae bacterium]|tara:strand:- start:461 stop:1192 length:732 start_codon:yes stop_codon:yes gene_type:complete
MGEAKRKQGTDSGSNMPAKGPIKGIIIGIVVVLVVVLAVYWLTRPVADPDELPTAAEGAGPFPAHEDRVGVSVGPEDASVVVREFADYQCPGCASFASVAKRIKDEFVASGDVRFVYFDFPLVDIHDNAMLAAQAARCAGDQGNYWAMHDRLFAQQGEWSTNHNAKGVFVRYSEELGMNPARLQRCLDTELHREDVEASLALAKRMGVRSTPTVLVNNIPMGGAQTWPKMKAVIERELETTKP